MRWTGYHFPIPADHHSQSCKRNRKRIRVFRTTFRIKTRSLQRSRNNDVKYVHAPICAPSGILITLPQVAAEKQRRKEEKRAAAAGNDESDLGRSSTPEGMNVDENDGQGFDGITSLRSVPISKSKDSSDVVKEQIPCISVFPGPSTLRQVVQKADVVLHVVDARDPAASMSDALAEAAQGKLIVLLNKAGMYDAWAECSNSHDILDTVPRESLLQWLVHLRTLCTVLPFRVSSAFMPSGAPFQPPNKKAMPIPKDDALGLVGLWTCLINFAQTKNSEELVVAVTGVTNVSAKR